MEALHRAEKVKQQNYLLAAAGGNRKGGIPTKQLRGINEADFFQKNNSDERASDLRTCRMFFQTTWMNLTCEFVSGKEEFFAKHGT